jgi:hypothetical protein
LFGGGSRGIRGGSRGAELNELLPQINHRGLAPGELFAQFEEERIRGLEGGGFALAEQPTHEAAKQAPTAMPTNR